MHDYAATGTSQFGRVVMKRIAYIRTYWSNLKIFYVQISMNTMTVRCYL